MTDSEFYRLRKKAGVCPRCGREDAFTMTGRSFCADCAEKARANKAAQYAVEEKKIRMYAQHCNGQKKRRDMGLCPTCGRPATPGYSTCEYCRAKHRNYMRNYRNSFTRGQYGICWQCNKREALPGKRVCQSCYDMKIRCQRQAIAVVAEMKESGWVHPWQRDDSIMFRGRAENAG